LIKASRGVRAERVVNGLVRAAALRQSGEPGKGRA
jgi:hypothetical protein